MASTLIGRKDDFEGEKLNDVCGEKERQNRVLYSSLSCVITALFGLQ